MSTLFSRFYGKINQISPLENNFTGVLDSIAVKPKMLYFRGKIPENMMDDDLTKRPKCVAIVGTRHCTKYGEEVAYKIAFELAKRGVVVVSGLAYGIDSVAHRAALDAGGVTVAVLGTPIDQIYPRAHEGLAREIIERDSMILSEFAPGEKVYPKTSFLARNRLIAGLSDAVVIVEAAERSGSLNTAMHALDQGKELFVVPGDITRPMSAGCNRLLKQGANPYTGIDDLLDFYFPKRRKAGLKQTVLFGDTPEEMSLIKIMHDGVKNGEEMVQKAGMSVALFNQTMTMLEIKGLVRSLGANQWMLK
ncbi:DNA-processing protein DprA [Candidatus Saccharibacteria bacterium]|nr:DNA-processing protein DprA [Candidatus Saccharibacteria bacterium]